jgi:hypothetical protein
LTQIESISWFFGASWHNLWASHSFSWRFSWIAEFLRIYHLGNRGTKAGSMNTLVLSLAIRSLPNRVRQE